MGRQPWALSLPDKELCLREALAVCTPPAQILYQLSHQGSLRVLEWVVYPFSMARVNVDILGISELKWTGMGEFNSDDHYIYSLQMRVSGAQRCLFLFHMHAICGPWCLRLPDRPTCLSVSVQSGRGHSPCLSLLVQRCPEHRGISVVDGALESLITFRKVAWILPEFQRADSNNS